MRGLFDASDRRGYAFYGDMQLLCSDRDQRHIWPRREQPLDLGFAFFGFQRAGAVDELPAGLEQA